MNKVTHYNIRMHDNGYCSQMRTSVPPIRIIEQGVEAIEKILAKGLLCRHDVEEINQIYQAVDLLERQIEQIPERNSHHALQKIIGKVKKIVSNKTISTQDLISLYHLQHFSDSEWQIDQYFKSVQRNVRSDSFQAIAEELPYCFSPDQFDEDVEFLIGPNRTEKVNKILQRKKKKLQDYEQLKRVIAQRKSDLEELRKCDPLSYPAYLDELLDNGYIHLYDHLLQMRALFSRNERRSKIEEIPFSLLSHIVLETREAIIQKVVKSIPADRSRILFLLGHSGAGKSTTLCFLRGDPMILKGVHYESQSDRQQIIGFSGAASCTFLPTIEIVQDWAIIDFPGFDDTNGSLISLGMECALKALITKYNPQVLVLEAITNNEGRLAAVNQLRSRLERLLKNNSDCLLGITKYSKDPDFIQIQAIEKKQKKKLLKPTPEEIALRASIETLAALDMPELQPKIEKMQQQLAKMQQEKEQRQQMELPDTDPKTDSRNRLQKKEEELLKEIGLEKIIRFDKLEDTSHLSSCFAAFSENLKRGPIYVCSQQRLDPDDERLLEDRFKDNLQQEMENLKDYNIKFENLKVFVRSVLETSLINTTFSQSNPEIGQFLHLPEIDPRLVRNYDKGILGSCIKKYISSIISTLNISFINKVLKEVEVKVPKKTVAKLNQKAVRLRDYVMGLLGSLPEDPQKAEERWAHLQKDHQSAIDSIEEKFKLPPWATVLLTIPVGIPYGIYTLVKRSKLREEEQKKIGEVIDLCCDELDQIYNALVKLKDLEKISEKQEVIDDVFYSGESFFESTDDFIASIQNKIQKIRDIYGGKDWDERIGIMKKKLDFSVIGDLVDFLSWLFFDKNISSSVPGARYHPLLRIRARFNMGPYMPMQQVLSRVSTDLDIDLKKSLFRAMLGAAVLSGREALFQNA
ncbi:hypothetical protein [Parachlamydia sp. AcF125]|uniref:hypothetical protein n=1 Tax=Parachlamydia sp. AcF125 TaxID=2795736 RepID=UPI001BC8CB59|nr:hypothetical protein [Parachlamydia sp. AcF125]MBS4168492.1 hypothetical protein [Parachlamydia sp. AcF125]